MRIHGGTELGALSERGRHSGARSFLIGDPDVIT
jgi:hypothetical protein